MSSADLPRDTSPAPPFPSGSSPTPPFPPRLLFVHAHPDDETLTTGATIAHYTAQGAQVTVVTCTLGEEGEIIGDRWAGLAVDAADQLGGYRIGELTAALAALGVPGPVYLGGAGRWRDSGMAGTAPRRRQRFVDADIDEAVGELVAIIDRIRPHVVVTYDPNGGYGHPDHIQAHRVTTAAVEKAQWRVPRFYWTVLSESAVRDGLAALTDMPAEWTVPEVIPFAWADDRIDVVLDASAHLDAKVAALRAHATQVIVAADGRSCALSNLMALPIVGREDYVLAPGVLASGSRPPLATDLLAGIDMA